MMMNASNKKSLRIDLHNGTYTALSCISLLSQTVEYISIRQTSTLQGGIRPTVTSEEIPYLLEEIGCMCPNLCRVDLTNFEETPVSVESLVRLVTNVEQLQVLRLDTVRISCESQNDFDALEEALEQHISLQEIQFVGCRPSEGTPTLEPLARAIAKTPTLQVVEIAETTFPPSGAWTGDALGELCRSTSLRILRVRGVRFLSDADIVLMAKVLETNHVMEELWLLSCELGFAGIGPAAIAEMLRYNTKLHILGLNRLCFSEHALTIAEALQYNSALRGLHLCMMDGLTSRVQNRFAYLLEKNYVLEKVSGGCFASEVDLYLRLNKAGRRNLLEDSNCTKQQWINVLEKQNDDLSALFYLLSKNPCLCQP